MYNCFKKERKWICLQLVSLFACSAASAASGCFSNALTGLKRFKKEGEIMYTTLFIISLVAFAYLMYVLIKPEKF